MCLVVPPPKRNRHRRSYNRNSTTTTITTKKQIMSGTRAPDDDNTASEVRYFSLASPSYIPLHLNSPQHVSFGPSFAAAPGDPHLAATYPAIYIYPNSSHHITFPLVNHAAAERAKHTSLGPVCYVAIAPHSAKPVDFELSLAPRDSGLVVLARLAKSQRTASLSSFRDIDKLREVTIQLEIWDKEDDTTTDGQDELEEVMKRHKKRNSHREEKRNRDESGEHA
ncbi:hypothetical protein GGR53DRAFT_471934 [Hypoxylon sp. FL1150]|nr:hypothetical protein GGR53DRAFT_471934 [Hypoxylon sp. FL1150]